MHRSIEAMAIEHTGLVSAELFTFNWQSGEFAQALGAEIWSKPHGSTEVLELSILQRQEKAVLPGLKQINVAVTGCGCHITRIPHGISVVALIQEKIATCPIQCPTP